MERVKLAVLAACLLALASGCSLTEPALKDFTLANQRPAKAEESGNTLQAAELACREETKTKGVASVVAICSRLPKGAADEDYVVHEKAGLRGQTIRKPIARQGLPHGSGPPPRNLYKTPQSRCSLRP